MGVSMYQSLIEFWFSDEASERWFKSTPEFDRQLIERYSETWQAAKQRELDHWCDTATGSLAMVILLDQFPRNMFRGLAAAFRTDCRALRTAKQAIGRGHDKVTPEPERQFFYLPLMHSEGLPDQERCVRLIKLEMPQTGLENLEHARRHREVIRKFGRFPSRNRSLGRHDTEAELHYRASGGYMS